MKKIYRENDPVWKAPLTDDDCLNIWSAVISQALSDATRGQAGERFFTGSASGKEREHLRAHAYVRSSRFDKHCASIGLDPNYLRKQAGFEPMPAPQDIPKRKIKKPAEEVVCRPRTPEDCDKDFIVSRLPLGFLGVWE